MCLLNCNTKQGKYKHLTYAERTILSYIQWNLTELDCINILKEIEYKDLKDAASRLSKFARSVNVLK